MLRSGDTRFLWKYETKMFGGNRQWADPEEALKVGETVGEELIGRFEDGDTHNSPSVHRRAHEVLDAALSVVDYAALPTERRANILRGVINALESNGELGGEPEWAEAVSVAVASDSES